ncbi:hypothetical protein [Flavobacterium sp. RSP15]|uniref:hypothetical protein n=1 Tax=Flavobacterium sp. RSP15 TaxID=2497485 RepID=UPI000F822FC0|nr:hypothetical protein [Flavobacterium sp. RSP15]RTY88107.1 hypothetical protein EKM00_02860 [Flavobacterium sp. RSP15]
MGNRAGSTPAPGTKTASKEAVFLVLCHNEFLCSFALFAIDCGYGIQFRTIKERCIRAIWLLNKKKGVP